MFIELHLLQNFAPSNLNRDESNSPKDCTFGGVRRARISSQCIKRSIRMHPSFAEATQVEVSSRTRYLASAISTILENSGKSRDEADLAARNVVGDILGGMDDKKPMQSKVLFFASKDEKEYLAKLLLENWEIALKGNFKNTPVEKGIKDFKKTFENRTSAPGIALFGRMLAEDATLNLDAACQVAHAISTHRVSMEFDFFTAVDDLQNENETGAAMMGLIGFNAATYYRYANINVDQLATNLDGNMDLVEKTIRGFLEASIKAIPTGKQNSFAAQNPPSFIMAVVRNNGATWSLANAFEKPVFPQGNQSLLEASVAALDKYWGEVHEFFGDDAKPLVSMMGINVDLPNLNTQIIPQMKTWIDRTLAEVSKE